MNNLLTDLEKHYSADKKLALSVIRRAIYDAMGEFNGTENGESKQKCSKAEAICFLYGKIPESLFLFEIVEQQIFKSEEEIKEAHKRIKDMIERDYIKSENYINTRKKKGVCKMDKAV